MVCKKRILTQFVKFMEYFTQFGYFPEGSENSILSAEARSRAIRTFQKINGLSETGEMNEATERAMQVPRCGRPDSPYESRRRKRGIRDDTVRPWKGETITFGVFRGSVKNSEGDTRAAMHKAAEVWMKHVNIKLVESAQNPQINMSYQSGRHAGCNSPFSEMTLAHAFPPSLSEKDQLGGDIHFNEMFTFNMEEYTSARGTSLLSVMTHEMGHSLGLPHNLEDKDSIMFPSELARPAKVTQLDKYRLQMLYGSSKEKEEAKKKMEEEIEKKPTLKPDTCKSSIDAITMHNDKFYVFKDEWMWLISYDGSICDEPTLIEKTIDGVSGPIDAAVSIDDHTGKPPQLWLFKKDQVFVTNGSRLLYGAMKLKDFDLPEQIKKIDLAYKWYYFDPPAVYIWSGNQYWKLDSSYHYRKIEPAYARLIKRNWKDAPENPDAAFSMENELHFVAGNRIYRMNSTIHTVPVANEYSEMSSELISVTGGANPRSHCLATSQDKDNCLVYASGSQLTVQKFPEDSPTSAGTAESVTPRWHTKDVTVVKRLKHRARDFFVSGSVDSTAILWELNDETQLEKRKILEGSKGSIASVCGCFFEDQWLIFASWVEDQKSALSLWWLDSDHHAVVHETISTDSFALSIDITLGHGLPLLACGTSKRLIDLYAQMEENLNSFIRVLSVTGHTDWIHSLAFNDSDNHLLLASAGQDTYVRLWRIDVDVKDEEKALSVTKNKFAIRNSLKLQIQVEAVLSGHEDWVHSTEWSNDGKQLVTSSSDKSIIVWRQKGNDDIWVDEVRLGIVGGQAAGFFSASFLKNARSLVATSYFGGVHGWRATNESAQIWSAVPMCGGHVDAVRDVEWDPTGSYLLTVGKDQTTRVYSRMKGEQKFIELARPQVHGHDLQCITVVNSGCFVSGAEEKILRAFQAPKTFVRSLENISGVDVEKIFSGLEISEQGARVPALGLSNKIVDEAKGDENEKIGIGKNFPDDENEDPTFGSAAFRSNPRILTAPPTEDCLQQDTLWPETHKLYAHGYEIYSATVNPTGKVLASACKASRTSDAVIVLWDTANWQMKKEVQGHQMTVTQIAWSKNGKWLLSVSRDRTAKVYKEKNGEANGFDYELVWSSTNEHSRIIYGTSWFDDSEHFVTVSRDCKAIIWKIDESGNSQPTAIYTCNQPINAVDVSRGSSREAIIALGLEDGSVELIKWGGAEIKLLQKLDESPLKIICPVNRLRFAPDVLSGEDKQMLACAGSDGKLKIYNIDLKA
ncbi:hypothetical protein WR25_26896 [Diploscapter pachys]|uniref:Elongator complex protein 2 n=1 Tax=Diploscapter pachys TaxID=2018661 RepID=A0A2A2JSQ2_9BILA|nr:hypothetical protein WR25_26896 [Diploscapter pachys]